MVYRVTSLSRRLRRRPSAPWRKPCCRLLEADNEIRVIGTRHGEKLYETLLNREEMAHAEDLGDYYRVPADARDLNYSSFFSKGKTEVSEAIDYNSHNTNLLDVHGDDGARCCSCRVCRMP